MHVRRKLWVDISLWRFCFVHGTIQRNYLIKINGKCSQILHNIAQIHEIQQIIWKHKFHRNSLLFYWHLLNCTIYPRTWQKRLFWKTFIFISRLSEKVRWIQQPNQIHKRTIKFWICWANIKLINQWSLYEFWNNMRSSKKDWISIWILWFQIE